MRLDCGTGFHHDRAATLASLERLKQIEKSLKATVILQHDPGDIDKLPAFPAAGALVPASRQAEGYLTLNGA